MAVLCFTDPRRKAVCGNPVRALGKDRYAIDHKCETLAGRIADLPQLQGSQAGTRRDFVDNLAVNQQTCLERIKWLGSETVWPPQLRSSDHEREQNAIHPRYQIYFTSYYPTAISNVVHDSGYRD